MPRDAGGAQGSGVACPSLNDYAWRMWDYWERHLDPELFIDRSLKGTWRQGGAGHGVVGHGLWRKSLPGGGRHHHHLRTRLRTSSTPPARNCSRTRGHAFIAYAVDIADMWTVTASCSQLVAEENTAGWISSSTMRAADPPRHREQLRPLPRLRAHHAAQLLWLPACDHGRPRHGGKAQGPHRQHQLHRRADQCPALSAYVASGGARCLTRCAQRVRRPGHHLHHHQHAAGAHAHDRAHADLQQRPRSAPRRPPTWWRRPASSPVRIATRLGILGR